MTDVWDENVCATQLTNGLCWCDHKYPKTAEADRSNGMRDTVLSSAWELSEFGLPMYSAAIYTITSFIVIHATLT